MSCFVLGGHRYVLFRVVSLFLSSWSLFSLEADHTCIYFHSNLDAWFTRHGRSTRRHSGGPDVTLPTRGNRWSDQDVTGSGKSLQQTSLALVVVWMGRYWVRLLIMDSDNDFCLRLRGRSLQRSSNFFLSPTTPLFPPSPLPNRRTLSLVLPFY